MKEMLKNFAGNLRSYAGFRDPSEFNDDIALRIEWKPFHETLVKFNTHRLTGEIHSSEMKYEPTPVYYFRTGLGLCVWLAGIAALSFTDLRKGTPLEKPEALMVVFFICFCFAVINLFEIFSTRKKKLSIDLTERCVIAADGSRIPFSDVHALQLVQQFSSSSLSRTSKTKSITNYQLNLVRSDGARIFAMNYAGTRAIRADAEKIAAAALDLSATRIWDMLPGYATASQSGHHASI
jgi:hypothetical protein